ncbi:DNA-directed RNA polymerase subunit alpha [Porphyromonas sp. oral taxon 278]|uniref:DNA-directed RNA polymerase subunit alpha n=1 Tax=Porphyromonas sp. oral taxon 278 TaxID=712437 RepID=UPI0003AD605D|nr:DNA-directed RNA polymerase subunit alpha [Porphyromonas sp. oral taxon 278]ERJ70530.1 DNA-directed RNA polymerase, alpha subunit [Porphyromonas sp. oral taxon 278 str. W7784]
MAILAFQKPENVLMMDATDSYAKFEFRPLEPGYATTVGNALRRILLSSLEGYAISTIKIEGVNHEFATIPGVLEDVTNIILNLKQVRFRALVPDATEETVSLTISSQKQFLAGELNGKLSSFEVLNPELVICHIDEAYSLTIELSINKGRGYIPADEKQVDTAKENELQTIAIDSIYTPIRNVKYFTENYRVEQKTDYEKLILEITTDGSIHPLQALKDAAAILIDHFRLFTDDPVEVEESADDEDEVVEAEDQQEIDRISALLKTELKDLDLSVRAQNCLRSGNVLKLADLVVLDRETLNKFRNFGKKSMDELNDLMERLGLDFGMDVSKYKLDND